MPKNKQKNQGENKQQCPENKQDRGQIFEQKQCPTDNKKQHDNVKP